MLGEEEITQIYDATEDTEVDLDAFAHIKKDLYLNKVFCWIESGDTQNVIKFYNTFPHLTNQLYTPNHWNPLMYAVRYGNMQLIKFLYEKGMKTVIQGIYNHVSIVHCAVYSGQLPILSYVLNSIYKNANPTNCETSPLKISMKTGNPRMVELLIAKGAYYTFGDVLNNLVPKETITQQTSKYTTIDTCRQINNSLVVEDNTIKDCPIKETLRWARIRQAMYIRHYAEKFIQITRQLIESQKDDIQIKEEEIDSVDQKIEEQIPAVEQVPTKSSNKQKILDEKHKFYGFSSILLNDDYYDNILKALVGKGDSILIKNDPIEQKQPRQVPRDSSQPQPKK